MSNVLDQLLIEDIARYCPQNFLAYHKCISENRENPMNCVPKQQELATCIKKEVPAFQKILGNCGQLLNDYNDCLKSNITNQQACIELLAQVRQCAENQVDLSKNTLNNLNPGK